ncbi:hypothetical protein T265_08203 [Opisthorchis viverrini]|uniref:Uncharacterized protein n=1 Tax=Opisthorchis viverrini TaxID=6198 RepID=A0A074ZKZ5_OPIVI|nr:hypothetical protein T265_08203 [Opisthorchis viverrini]KER24030.1 hypothetical protein T265_08203 [Opisthorchis viverrini]
MPKYHATQRKHGGWDTARLSKPRRGDSTGRGRVRTTDFPPYCEEKSKGEQGSDVMLAYHNHSEVPTPPDIHSGNLNKN